MTKKRTRIKICLSGMARSAIDAGNDVYGVHDFGYGWKVIRNGNIMGDSRNHATREAALIEARAMVAIDPDSRLLDQSRQTTIEVEV